MKILHINVAGICDKFYDIFFDYIQRRSGFNQIVYIPYAKKDYKEEELLRFDKYDKSIEIKLRPIKSSKDRLFYFSKINKYTSDLKESIDDIKSIDVIHAHSLFSDGGVAYKLYKQYGIPYILAVRATDISLFLKYFIHLRPFIRKVLLNADKIIFLNPNIKKDLLEKVGNSSTINQIEKRSIILPNGINQFWLDEIYYRNTEVVPKFNILQVGRLNKNKNQVTTLHAIKKLLQKGYEVEADFIGEGEELDDLLQCINELGIKDNVRFHGFINDKRQLIDFYRQSNYFILPSYSETLGIAYIEAMSQGLPIVYTKNQGIDGYFEKGTVGIAVIPSSAEEICDAIIELSNNYMEFSRTSTDNSKDFNWENIINKYIELYTKMLVKENNRR